MQLLKTTIVGGVIFLIPLIIVIMVLGKAFKIMLVVAQPLSAWIPVDSVGGIALINILAVLAILVCCLIAGILSKGALAKRLSQTIESKLLFALPGYSFVKGITDSMNSSEEAAKDFIPVLAQLDDNALIGFEIERNETGDVVVFLPGSPNPWSGSVAYFREDRIRKLNLTVPEAIKKIRLLGRGSVQYCEQTENVEKTLEE